jgi:hypothetical protein
MPSNPSQVEEIVRKFENDFTNLYGLEDPTNTFHDHDDFLIIRDNIKSFLRTTLQKVREETIQEALSALPNELPEDLHDIEWQEWDNERIREKRFQRQLVNCAILQSRENIEKLLLK